MSLLGSKAPAFNLQNDSFDYISLNNYLGNRNVLILFYPLAFSKVCTKELCLTRDNMKIYNSLDAEVLAISVDSIFVQKAFKRSQNFNFELLSDFNKEVSRLYNSFYDEYFGMKGVSKRSAFVIDKEGIVNYEEIHDKDNQIPDFKNIQKALIELG